MTPAAAPVPVVVAVIGAGAETTLLPAARTVGQRLAQGGATVVTGGLGGVMAAACEGARAAGGTTLGLLPGIDRREANPWVTVPVPTGLGEGRNLLVVRSADAVVAVGGEYGTLSEIALALKTGVPVVGYRTWRLVRDGRVDPGVEVVDDPGLAADRALALAAARCGSFPDHSGTPATPHRTPATPDRTAGTADGAADTRDTPPSSSDAPR